MPIAGIILGNSDSINQSSTNGWTVGHMQNDIAKSSDVEIKMWNYPEPFDYGRKSFAGTEFISIDKGVLRLEIEHPSGIRTVILNGRTRDYIVISPNAIKQVFFVEPASGITVRWPSTPGLSRIL